MYLALQAQCQAAPMVILPAIDMGEIDVHLVHAPVFHLRRNGGDDGLELARKLPVARKIHRQQNRLRTQLGRLHHAHGRAHPKGARLVGGRGDHPAPNIVLE
ncbi:hypothetical protein D3C71_1877010 [compost metagenome]